MRPIERAFAAKQAYLAYLTAGDGGLEFSEQAMLALIKGGVDLLEVGVPFSDPIADGPVIQRATERSLARGTTVFDVLRLVEKIKNHCDVPIVLFSYYNPILSASDKSLFKQARSMGVDGMLIVDLPLEEAEDYREQCLQAEIDPIFIISPMSSKQRIIDTDHNGRGFLYYACRKGTTGTRQGLPDDFASKLTEIKELVDKPVVAGFGISNRETASKVLEYADGFVIGSAFVQAIENGASPDQLQAMAEQLDPRREVAHDSHT